jgi:hypothetical protein
MKLRSTESARRSKLRNRIRSFYRHLENGQWDACYGLVDPKLRDGKIDRGAYGRSLSAFLEHYGPIEIIAVPKLNIYSNVQNNKHDDRDFAYGLVVWQDKNHQPHLLKERWVWSDGNWYTRMVGLVTHETTRA